MVTRPRKWLDASARERASVLGPAGQSTILSPLLESALAAANNRHHYEGADVVSCAATYAYHLTQTHAFFDGNKRVAAAITEAFLETNGFELTMSNAEVVSLFLAIASSQLSREQVEQRLREKVKPKN